MATEKIRIEYEVNKGQLEAANKTLDEFNESNELTQKEIDQTSNKFKEQDKSIAATNKAFGGLGAQLVSIGNKFQIAGKGAGDMASGLFKTATATDTTSKAMKFLKVAIASTGIGLLVVALGSLVTFFTKTQRGADLVSKAMAGISATVGVLIDRASNLGESIVSAFRNPKQAIKDLGKFLIDNIVNRFTAVIDLVKIAGQGFQALANRDLEALKKASIDAGQAIVKMTTGLSKEQQDKIAQGIAGVTEEIRKESAAAIDFEKRNQALIERRRAFSVEEIKLQNQIAKARLDAEDAQIRQGETGEEANQRQVEAIRRAIALENELANRRESIAKENLEIIAGQVALGESMNDELDAQAQAEVELLSIQGQRDERLKALTARETSLTGALRDQKQARKELNEETAISISQIDEEIDAMAEELEAIIGNAQTQSELLNEIAENDTEKAEERIERETEQTVDNNFRRANSAEELKDTKVQVGNDLLNNSIALAGRETALGKATAATQIGINTAVGIANATKIGANAAPYPANLVAIGTGIATVLGGIAQARSVGIFEKGGKIGGNLHSNGGTLIEAERDEFVMSRKATAKYGFGFMDKINGLELDPNILNGKSGGSTAVIMDTTPIANQLKKMPQNVINVDEEGFTLSQIRNQSRINKRIKRYST